MLISKKIYCEFALNFQPFQRILSTLFVHPISCQKQLKTAIAVENSIAIAVFINTFCPITQIWSALFFSICHSYAIIVALSFIVSITFIKSFQTLISLNNSVILPLSVNGDSCNTDFSFRIPLWTTYSIIWFTK